MFSRTVFSLFAVVCLFAGCVGSAGPSAEETDRWIQRYVEKLDQGESQVYLYSTVNTDKLLKHIAGRAEVELITLEDTDLSSDGLRYLRSFPNLKEFSFNWIHGPDQEIVELLADCQNLRRLEVGSKSLAEKLDNALPDCEVFVHWKMAE